MTDRSIRERAGTAGMRVLLYVSLVAMIVGAAAPALGAPIGDELLYDDDTPTAPNPYFDVDTQTKSTHEMSWGDSFEALRDYKNDDGEVVTGEYRVNTTDDHDDGDNVNPITIDPSKISDDDFDAFPRRGDDEDDEDTDDSAAVDNLASATDASEWSKSGANKSKLTLSDAATGSDVDALGYTTASMAAGDVATATYSNWTTQLDNDEQQRVLQVGVVVNTLDSATRAYVNVTDENGDRYSMEINGSSSASRTNQDTIAASTGTFYAQQKLADLTLITTDGDGTFDNIESIEINTTEGDFDGDFYWIDLEQKSKTTLGEKWATTDDDGNDDDGDGDWDETQTIENGSGTYSVKSLETLDTSLDDATLNDIDFPAKWNAEYLDGDAGEEGEYKIEWGDAEDYPSYDQQLDVYYRMELPAVIELAYSGVDLEHDQKWPSGRYVLVESEADVGEDANFTDVDDEDDDYIDYADSKTSLFGTQDETVTIYSGASSDTFYGLHYRLVFTDAEAASLQDTGSSDATPAAASSGGGLFAGGGGGGMLGGIMDFLFSIPGLIVSAVGVVLAGRRGWFDRILPGR